MYRIEKEYWTNKPIASWKKCYLIDGERELETVADFETLDEAKAALDKLTSTVYCHVDTISSCHSERKQLMSDAEIYNLIQLDEDGDWEGDVDTAKELVYGEGTAEYDVETYPAYTAYPDRVKVIQTVKEYDGSISEETFEVTIHEESSYYEVWERLRDKFPKASKNDLYYAEREIRRLLNRRAGE